MSTAIFNLSAIGSGSCGTETWVDIGAIPTGQQIWIGADTFGTPSKAMTFEIRGNATSQSAGTTGATAVLATLALKSGATGSQDLYKKGALIIRTVVGTGVEHWWLRAYSKSSTAAAFNYNIKYTNY